MAAKKMRPDSNAKLGILILAVALQASPAFADESDAGGSGFFSSLGRAFSSLFQSPRREEPAPVENSQASQEVPIIEKSTWATSQEVEEMRADMQARQAQQRERERAEPVQAESRQYSQESQQQYSPRARTASTPAMPVTSDSSFSLSGAAPAGARWLMIMSQKQGESAVQEIIPTSEGSALPIIYLHQGAGTYKVGVYVSTSNDRTTNSYQYLSSASVRNEDARDNAFLLPSASIQADDLEIMALSAKITRGLRTDREKALAIHDWLTREIVYDSKGLRTGEYTTRPQDARSVLQTKLAVCDGFTNLFAALSRAAGIQAKVITGPLGIPSPSLSREQLCDYKRQGTINALHAWNEVYVDNRWVTLDATLDTGSTNTKIVSGKPDVVSWKRTPNNHELFDPLPSRFERNHTKCVEDLR